MVVLLEFLGWVKEIHEADISVNPVNLVETELSFKVGGRVEWNLAEDLESNIYETEDHQRAADVVRVLPSSVLLV